MESSGMEGAVMEHAQEYDINEHVQEHERYIILQPITSSYIKDEKQFDLCSPGGTPYPGPRSSEPSRTSGDVNSCRTSQPGNVCNPGQKQDVNTEPVKLSNAVITW